MRLVKILGSAVVMVGALTGAPAAGAAPPVNDAFDHPVALGDVPFRVEGTLRNATLEPGEPDHGQQSVWYAFRPSRTARVALDVVKSAPEIDPVISVYTGSALSALGRPTMLPGPVLGRVAFVAVAGETYRIAVANDACSEGEDENGVVTIDCRHHGGSGFTLRGERAGPIPRNDAFGGAATVRVPGGYRGDLTNATVEPGEDVRHSASLWYRLRPRRTEKVLIDFGGVGYDCGIWLYRGRTLDRLTVVAQQGPSGDSHPEPLAVTVRRGTRYHIAVSCSVMMAGDFALTLSHGLIAATGLALRVDPGQTLAGVRKRGFRVYVPSKRPAVVDVDLHVSRRMANQLGLPSRILGHARGTVDPSAGLIAVIHLTRAARKALSTVDRLRARVRLEVLGTNAPSREISVPVKL
jgi:hypothetical protein